MGGGGWVWGSARDLEADASALGVHVRLGGRDDGPGRGQKSGPRHGGASRHGELPLAAASDGHALHAVGGGGGGGGVVRGGGEAGRGDGGVGKAEAVAEAGDVPRIAHSPLLRPWGIVVHGFCRAHE